MAYVLKDMQPKIFQFGRNGSLVLRRREIEASLRDVSLLYAAVGYVKNASSFLNENLGLSQES